jgi:hypothetical protein
VKQSISQMSYAPKWEQQEREGGEGGERENQWFQNWAVPPPGGSWDYPEGAKRQEDGRGALEVGPSKRVFSLI